MIKQVDVDTGKSLWALVYLMTEKGRDGFPLVVFPGIHGVYATEEDAEYVRVNQMVNPSDYKVCRANQYNVDRFK